MTTSSSDDGYNSEICDLCVEFWKLLRGGTKAAKLLPKADARRWDAQLRYSERQLQRLSDDLGLRLVDYEGEEFHPGIAASADNAEDFEDGIPLKIIMTLEPAVVKDMRVMRTGRVVVAAKSQSKE